MRSGNRDFLPQSRAKTSMLQAGNPLTFCCKANIVRHLVTSPQLAEFQAMGCSTGCHTAFHHPHHPVRAPGHRFRVPHGDMRLPDARDHPAGLRRARGRSSRKLRRELEYIRKRHRSQHFRQRGCFSTISGTITDDVIMRCLDRQTRKHGFSPSPSTCRPPAGRSFRDSGWLCAYRRWAAKRKWRSISDN